MRGLHKQDHWALGTEEEETFDLPRHVQVILDKLGGLTPVINVLRERLSLSAGLACVIYVTQPTPILSFTNEQLRQIAELGADFDIDTYWLGADGDDPPVGTPKNRSEGCAKPL